LLQIADDRPHEHAAKVLLGVGALGMMAAGVLDASPFALGSGAMMAGLLVLSRVIIDLRRGVTSSNWGTWRLRENRLAFRRNICFWGVVTVLWFVLGTLAMLQLIRLPSP
jgi:hypothetical protein